MQVEAPPLAIIVPLLVRGLRERTTAIKRKSCVIIDNMAKLVDNPADAAPFLPKLIPELEKVRHQGCRQLCAMQYVCARTACQCNPAPRMDQCVVVC